MRIQVDMRICVYVFRISFIWNITAKERTLFTESHCKTVTGWGTKMGFWTCDLCPLWNLRPWLFWLSFEMRKVNFLSLNQPKKSSCNYFFESTQTLCLKLICISYIWLKNQQSKSCIADKNVSIMLFFVYYNCLFFWKQQWKYLFCGQSEWERGNTDVGTRSSTSVINV